MHFDLTGLSGVGALKDILLKVYLGKFQPNELQSIIQQQLDCFEQKIGQQPDFIDGHQHVHQFPQVRDTLLDCLVQRYDHKIPIRTKTYQTDLKAKIIYFLGGYKLRQKLIQQQWSHNPSFAGIYSFNTDLTGLKTLWEGWLKQASNNSVIMCHSARIDRNWTDEIYAARCIEYEWLLSDEFLALWDQYACRAQSWKNLGE
ncbi:ChbG/HpnK family deacetylase [Acinetobacter faecalis]|uniref:ChbG/HpnK family deacetylase n=1 Tax=Acinetobacter faecalis TaxID=2665161 RepID=UPI002A915941|nr:ChbG/HpnK family deacetylase [Acinetobacter faecalis]MDY6483043.1 ChbG/HpnK family deacetylase [Acinetobacter faecalis]